MNIQMAQVHNKLVNRLVKSGVYFSIPDYPTLKYTLITGINEYEFDMRNDDVDRSEFPMTILMVHYFSNAFDEILQNYKKEHENIDTCQLKQLFNEEKDNLHDLGWLIVGVGN